LKVPRGLRKRLHRLWLKTKLLNCDFRGLGMAKALKLAEGFGLDPRALIFSGVVKREGDITVGVVYAANEDTKPEDMEYGRWNSFNRVWRDVKSAVGEGYKYVWVRFGLENLKLGKEDLPYTVVVVGGYYDEWYEEFTED